MTLPPECVPALRDFLTGLYEIGGGEAPVFTDEELRAALGQDAGAEHHARDALGHEHKDSGPGGGQFTGAGGGEEVPRYGTSPHVIRPRAKKQAAPARPPAPAPVKPHATIATHATEHIGRTGAGAPLDQLFAKVKQAHPELSKEDFRQALIELHNDEASGQFRLGGWPRVPSELPDPDVAPTQQELRTGVDRQSSGLARVLKHIGPEGLKVFGFLQPGAKFSQQPEHHARESADAGALERAKAADLITLPPDVKGTRCGNCVHFKDDFCHEPRVDQPVTENDCCNFWAHPGTQREWQDGLPSG